MKVLFIASDNSNSSGAFLSMTALNVCLNREHNIETMVILPREGSGDVLLRENSIPYKIIKSYDWITQKDEKKTLRFKIKYFFKRILNQIAANKIAKIVKDGNYEIVHINTIYSYVGALAARKVGVPYVWHIREIIESGQNRKFISPRKSYALIGQAAGIMAISESVYKNYFSRINCRNMRIVYNGIDSARFYKKNKRIFTSDKTIIAFIGGFNINKGAYTLCDALARVATEKERNIEIWFIGDPTERFKDYVTGKGLDSIARFWGYQKNVEELLEKTDITITGGKAEAFGRTTAEAMLCGNLVIGTDTAGSKELVMNKETGLSYAFGNVDQLVEQIEYALDNREEMRDIANRGREFIKNNMTAEINAQSVYESYQRIMFKHGKVADVKKK